MISGQREHPPAHPPGRAEKGVLPGAPKIGINDEGLQARCGKGKSQVIDGVRLPFPGQGAGNGQNPQLAPTPERVSPDRKLRNDSAVALSGAIRKELDSAASEPSRGLVSMR